MTGSPPIEPIAPAHGPDAARDLHCEQLSAMMDGMLSDDESRFLLRRMQHDAELAGSWERWQLYGDAMRGSAGRALPADFNRRVAQAIAADAVQAASAATVATTAQGGMQAASAGGVSTVSRPLLRWGGGAALAASMALAAVIGLRPDAVVAPDSGAVLVDSAADGSASPESAPVDPNAPAIFYSAPVPTQTASGASMASAAVSAEIPPAVDSNANRRLASVSSPAPRDASTAAASARARSTPSVAPSSSDPAMALTAQSGAGRVAQVPDFGAEDAPLTPKPWPRSLLRPRSDDGLMVDFGRNDGRSFIVEGPVQAPQHGASPRSADAPVVPAGPESPGEPTGDSQSP